MMLIGSASVTLPQTRCSGSPSARPKTSQIASSRHAIAWSARPRSRRMSLVEGSMASQAPSGSVGAPTQQPRRQLVMDDPDESDCSTSVSPL